MRTNLSTASHQIQGKRPCQEDSHLAVTCSQQDRITDFFAIVADGMGGHKGGFIASSIIVDTFSSVFQSSEQPVSSRLMDALQRANHVISQKVSEQPELEGMGATLAAIGIVSNELFWISVGDSPLFLLRNGELRRLNEDHSMTPVFAKLAETGQLSENIARTDPGNHILRSAVRGSRIKLIDQPGTPFMLLPGDQLLLASDGIDTLTHPRIAAALQRMADFSCEQSLHYLFQEITQENHPAQDNATAILLRIQSENNLAENAYVATPESVACYSDQKSNEGGNRKKESKNKGLLSIATIATGAMAMVITFLAVKKILEMDDKAVEESALNPAIRIHDNQEYIQRS